VQPLRKACARRRRTATEDVFFTLNHLFFFLQRQSARQYLRALLPLFSAFEVGTGRCQATTC
jgi:hypothetical protein